MQVSVQICPVIIYHSLLQNHEAALDPQIMGYAENGRPYVSMIGPKMAKPNKSAFLHPESSRTKGLGSEHLGSEQEAEIGDWEPG